MLEDFLDTDTVIRDPEASVRYWILLPLYASWCSTQGLRRPMQTTFTKDLEEAGFKVRLEQGKLMIHGLKLP